MESILMLFLITFVGIIAIFLLGGVFGLITLIAFKLALVAVYFIPTIIAAYKKHPQILWIFLINLFFGWSVIGWIIPLLWALDFDKTIKDFREFQAAKNAKDATIEGEIVKDDSTEG